MLFKTGALLSEIIVQQDKNYQGEQRYKSNLKCKCKTKIKNFSCQAAAAKPRTVKVTLR